MLVVACGIPNGGSAGRCSYRVPRAVITMSRARGGKPRCHDAIRMRPVISGRIRATHSYASPSYIDTFESGNSPLFPSTCTRREASRPACHAYLARQGKQSGPGKFYETGGSETSMQQGAFGDRLGRSFKLNSPPVLQAETSRGTRLAVTELRIGAPGHGVTSPMGTEDAY